MESERTLRQSGRGDEADRLYGKPEDTRARMLGAQFSGDGEYQGPNIKPALQALHEAYRKAGAPYGDNAAGYARWLLERNEARQAIISRGLSHQPRRGNGRIN